MGLYSNYITEAYITEGLFKDIKDSFKKIFNKKKYLQELEEKEKEIEEKKKKDAEAKIKAEEERKALIEWYNNEFLKSNEYKQLEAKRQKLGKQIASDLIANLKRYIRDNKFDEKYKDSIYSYKKCCNIKYSPQSYKNGHKDFSVTICGDYDTGIDWSQIDKYLESKGLDKSKYQTLGQVQKLPEFNNKWYYELIEEACNIMQDIAYNDDLDDYYTASEFSFPSEVSDTYYLSNRDDDYYGFIWIDLELEDTIRDLYQKYHKK